MDDVLVVGRSVVGRSFCHHGDCDDQGASDTENLFLVLSNLAYVLPIVAAWHRRVPWVGAWFVWVGVASTLHHLCIGELWCIAGLSCHELRVGDHIFAFGTVNVLVLFVLQYDVYDRVVYTRRRLQRDGATLKEVEEDGVERFFWWMLVFFGMQLVVALMVARNPTDPLNIAVIGAVASFAIVLKLVALDMGRTNWQVWDWRWLLGALTLMAGGIVLFLIDDVIAYWTSHSWWHILGAFGAAAIV